MSDVTAKVNRVLIAGTGSGCGKTTLTCAVLQALKNRGADVGAAKCGPDYIDPMFHRSVIGAPSTNLDPFFFDENTLRFLLAKNGAGRDITVVEGVMGYYDGLGLTTSRASAYGRRKERIALETPKGITLELDIEDIKLGESAVSCAVRKDAGDDPDVTDGALVYSTVSFSDAPGVSIDGSEGVGRVTKPGLDQPVGNAAINSVPRRMIRENVEEVMKLFDCAAGLSVVISIPAGAELAKKTFNPRLGIVGGISVLGTTGIVEPMSEKALVETIRTELTQRRALGHDAVLLTPGNYGVDFIRTSLGLDPETAVQTSSFIGDSLDVCRSLGFKRALLIGHIGKLVKLAGNMMNTHSKYGDCRMEILASHAGAAGAYLLLLRGG